MTSVASKSSSFFGSMVKFSALKSVATAAFDVAKGFFQMSMDIQQSKVAYEVLLGSSEKATKMLGEMKKFADTTPFEFKDLAKAGETMLAFNLPANQVMKTMSNIGDIAKGDAEKLQGLTKQFSKVASQGKITGENLNSMIDNGFNPLAEMARTSGKDYTYFTDQMRKGAVTSDMVANAFETATSKGGTYYNMMEKMSQTTAGRLSTLKDLINTIGVSLVDNLLPAINAGMSWLSELLSKFDQIKAAVQPIIDVFANLFDNILKSFSENLGGVDLSIDGLIETLKNLVDWITPLYESIGEVAAFIFDSVMQIVTPLMPVIKLVMGYTFIVFKALQVALKVIMFGLKPVIFILKGIAEVFGFIAKIAMEVWGIISKLIEKFMELDWVKSLIETVTGTIGWLGDKLQWLYDNTIGPIIDGIVYAIDLIKDVIGGGEKIELVKITKEQIDKGVADRNSKEGRLMSMAISEAQKNPNSLTSKRVIEQATKAGWFLKPGETAGGTGTGNGSGGTGKNIKTPTAPNSVKSNSPNIITVTIGKLIEEFTIETTNITDGYSKVKELVARALIEAVNDVSTTQ